MKHGFANEQQRAVVMAILSQRVQKTMGVARAVARPFIEHAKARSSRRKMLLSNAFERLSRRAVTRGVFSRGE